MNGSPIQRASEARPSSVGAGLAHARRANRNTGDNYTEKGLTPMRACLECGDPIPAERRTSAKTCSTECARKRIATRGRKYTAERAPAPKVRADRKCAECPMMFTPYRDNSRFCSRKCGWLWHQREKRGLRHDGMTSCNKCGEDTPRKPGIAVCDDCKVDPRANSYEKERARTLRSYDLTQEQFDDMLKRQNFRCAICRTDRPQLHGSRTWSIDHCHATGQVRGLLCGECNTALGLFSDNVETLLAAAEYLLDARKDETA